MELRNATKYTHLGYFCFDSCSLSIQCDKDCDFLQLRISWFLELQVLFLIIPQRKYRKKNKTFYKTSLKLTTDHEAKPQQVQ